MRATLILMLIGLAYLCFWPIPVSPVAYVPEDDVGLSGKFAPNDVLDAAEMVTLPDSRVGPEDLAVLADGIFYTADKVGALYQYDGDVVHPIAELGGRPLGLDVGPDGALYIADSFRGVLRWTKGGAEELVTEVDGAPLIYANQLDVGLDGTIYFSNSSDRFDPEMMGGTKPTSVMAIWEQTPDGYVARRDPDGTVMKIAEGFVYANGVALSPDEDFLLIAETGRARVHKLWLIGEKAGTHEVLMDNLPGYPDNIEPMGDGTYWVAFASPRVPAEALMPYPFLRKVIWRLGPWVRPAPIEHGIMVHFDGDGEVLRVLQNPSGSLGITTGGRVVGDTLYIMTLESRGFGKLKFAE
ncbi:MAG: SMP-30/gluconolactonase/LRE family protein [Paracoccaceae bacterium]